MNCEQFETRVLQLLDERASLSLDMQVQQHARHCAHCHRALSVYSCFSTLAFEDTEREPVPVEVRSSAKQMAWQNRQRKHVRSRILFAAVALVFVSLILVAQPVAPPSSTASREIQPSPVTVEEADTVGSSSSLLEGFNLTGMISDAIPSGLSGVTNVDISSIGRIDFFSLMPQEPVQAVRNLPATIETIQPYYQYSTDFPMMNKWSSGINYTIGLIQSSLPYSGAEIPQDSNDFGSKQLCDGSDLC